MAAERASARRPRARHLAWFVALALAGVAQAQPPELDYLQHCLGCHREDGSGSARNGVPDMRGVIGRFARVPSGRAFLVQVAGVAQAPLDDAALAALINWLLPRMDAAGLPDDFTPYTAAEIGRLRAARPGDLGALRAQALADLAASEGRASAAP
ncbi:MAG: hypothetical protein RLW61_11145 [Gammaproteobacteria bacterium]